MRQIIIDTETTGLYPQQGHRIIELAGLEVINRRATGRTVHFHLDPEREIDFGATEVHGLTWDDLKGKPKFREIAAEFIDFARGAEWVIHNAPFDLSFLDIELGFAGSTRCADVHASVIDTLALARELFPGKRNSLDALCERFRVDNAHRALHGALLDAQLLAEVYLAMTRGQETLTIDIAGPVARSLAIGADPVVAAGNVSAYLSLKLIMPSIDEMAAHHEYLAVLNKESKGRCIWLARDSSRAVSAAP